MTLQIQNIYYDHAIESRVYERGVYTIDSITKRIHIHDGVTPNGISTPITADLNQFATKNLSNVTQEDITNMLTNYGAVNMNSSAPVTTTQRDNLYGKLYLDGIKSDATLPASNYLKINPSTRKVEPQATSIVPTYFPCIDVSQTSYVRAVNVDYTASRHCCVVISGAGANNYNIGNFFIDGVQVFNLGLAGDRSAGGTFTQEFFIAQGSVYRATGAITAIKEYGIKKLTF